MSVPSETPSENHWQILRVEADIDSDKSNKYLQSKIHNSRQNASKSPFDPESFNCQPLTLGNLKINHNSLNDEHTSNCHYFNSFQQHIQNHDSTLTTFQKPVKQAEFSQDQDGQSISISCQSNSLSDKFEKYLDLMGQSQQFQHLSRSSAQSFRYKFSQKYENQTEELQNDLSKQKIYVLPYQQLISSTRLLSIRHFAGYQIVRVDVRVGKYQKTVTIYNLLEESCFHSMKPFNSGSFGNIYRWRYMEKEFVVKCITKTSVNSNDYAANSQNKQVILIQILKEYMIAYIAGVLDIGPKVVNPFGFDLIVSRKCIEFFIEKVSLLQCDLKNLHLKFDQIKQSLFSLHLLNIVHNDIKPQNIMYSRSTNKLLFIDFGLSEYINTPIGYKKSTKFIGTFQFSSPEMQKLLFQNETGLIDLYYNDAYSLNVALNKLFQIQKGADFQEINREPQHIENQIMSFLNKIYLKYMMLEQNIHNVISLSNIIELKRKFQLQQEILVFLQKLPFSPLLKHFYHESIHYSVRDLPKFSKLQDLYIKNFSPQNVKFVYKDQNYKDFADLYQHFLNMQLLDQQEQTTFRQRLMNKQQKKKLISTEHQNLPPQKIFTLYLDMIHFLKRNQNISLKQKSQLSFILIKRFQIPQTFCQNSSSPISPLLEPIFECLFYLIKYCFNEPINKWKEQNFAKVTSILMTLGWDIPDEYLKHWKHILCTSVTEIRKILQIFLEFMILDRLAIQRFFKVYNEKSLQQLNQMINARDYSSQLPKSVKKSIYHHVLEQRKRQNLNKTQYSKKELQDIFLSMLQLEQNPELRTQEKLDDMFKQIQKLPYSIFKNKKHYQSTKMNLLFWIDIHYCMLRIDQQKQLKILHKIKKQTVSAPETQEIQIFTFQLLSKYSIMKNLTKLKDQLDRVDQTINAPIIAENFCVPRRLIRAFMLKDCESIYQILERIQSIKTLHLSDVDLFRHLANNYQNTLWVYKVNRNFQDYRGGFHEKTQIILNDFVMNFKEATHLKQQKACRQSFSQFVRAIMGLSYNDKNFNKFNLICRNQSDYLKIFQQLLKQYPDNEMLKSYVMSKINQLKQNNKHEEICQLMERENRLILLNLTTTNHLDVSILIEYYHAKINLKKDEDFYLAKFKELYDEMVQNKSFHTIFRNRNFFYYVIKLNEDSQLALEFFKIITEYLTQNPSTVNTENVVVFIQEYYNSGLNKARKLAKSRAFENKNSFIRQNQEEAIQQIQFELSNNFFSEVYKKVKSAIKDCQIWQNPYLVLILFSLSLLTKKIYKDFRKILLLTAKTLKYLNQLARKYILNFYYWRMKLIQILYDKMRVSIGLNGYLNKKHLSHTQTKHMFEQIVGLRIRKNDYPEALVKKYPGYSQVRNKLYNYYNNLDIIKKINYVQVTNL